MVAAAAAADPTGRRRSVNHERALKAGQKFKTEGKTAESGRYVAYKHMVCVRACVRVCVCGCVSVFYAQAPTSQSARPYTHAVGANIFCFIFPSWRRLFLSIRALESSETFGVGGGRAARVCRRGGLRFFEPRR